MTTDEMLSQIHDRIIQVGDQIGTMDEKIDRKIDAVEARVGDLEISQAELKTKVKVVWGLFTASLVAAGTGVAGWLGFK